MSFEEKYYLTKLSGEFFGPWSEIRQEDKDYVASTVEFRKWKLWQQIKNIFRNRKNRLTHE